MKAFPVMESRSSKSLWEGRVSPVDAVVSTSEARQAGSSLGKVTDVQHGANETGSASSQVLSAAQSLSGDSNRLKLEVGKFLDAVRAA
jgi:methyl-accepting chemotaxis protein